MRLAMAAVVLVLTSAIIYVASPLWAAWSLREAIRRGDSAYLERKVEWEGVRSSLKASLAKHAQLVPEIAATEEPIKPGLWQRVKIAFGQSMIDSFVERYVTPAGLPKLFEARNAINSRVKPVPSNDEGGTISERFKTFWARLKRAEFLSPSLIEIEIADRNDPSRHYVSVLELKSFEWKLTGLRVTAPAPAPSPISREAMAEQAPAR